MTYNQLINQELIDFLTSTKKSFINVMNDSRTKWLGYFNWACDEIFDFNKVPPKKVPVRKCTYNLEHKADLYIIDYDDSFVNRENDSYCLCVTFDGDKFRLFTHDKGIKNGKECVYFTEKFLHGETKIISEVRTENYNLLLLNAGQMVNNGNLNIKY